MHHHAPTGRVGGNQLRMIRFQLEQLYAERELAGFVAEYRARFRLCYRNPGFAVLELR